MCGTPLDTEVTSAAAQGAPKEPAGSAVAADVRADETTVEPGTGRAEPFLQRAVRGVLSWIPGTDFFRSMTALKRLRHRYSLLCDPRTNSTFTGFLRLPTQFEALSGPVVRFLTDGRPVTALKIAVLGCSNGAEAYSIASVLRRRYPDLALRIRGYDIDPACIREARGARYNPEEIFNNKMITESFVQTTFDRQGQGYTVKPEFRHDVDFEVADILMRDAIDRIGPSDIVCAQNFIFHMKPRLARQALQNMLLLMSARSALFVDGVDLAMRQGFVRKNGLIPLEYEIERIHEEARHARAVGWPHRYWGLEPFLTHKHRWQERYATIFLRQDRAS